MKVYRFLLLISLVLLLVLPGVALAGVAGQGGTQGGSHSHEVVQPIGVPLLSEVSLKEVGYSPHLDAQVPLDIPFTDDTGKQVTLGDYLKGGPLLISINDFRCEDVCPIELQQLVDALNQITFKLGADYNVLAVTIDPTNTVEEAAAFRAKVVHRYLRPDAPNAAEGWRFLVGEQSSILRLTQAVGMKYAYDSGSKSFAHPVGVILLTPQGRIARYLYGMEFPPNQLRLAMYEAAQGAISSYIEPILLLCYHYDVQAGRYTNVAMTIVRTGGVLTVLGLGTFIGVMVRRDVKGRKPDPDQPGAGAPPDAKSEE